MNETNTLKNVIVATVITMVAACSSDDPEPPRAPTVDCNVTGPSVSLTANPTLCGEDDGEIVLDIDGGTSNLTININSLPLRLDFANNTCTSLSPGTYTIEEIATDNCSSTATATVSYRPGNVSYLNDVDPIIQARCAISGCHVAGTAQPDYTIFAELQSRAHNNPLGIRQRVKTDDMPRQAGNDTQPGDPLSAQEKALIFCWIDEGALDN